MNEESSVIPGDMVPAQSDPWYDLKKFTAARIALGSTGVSVPIAEVLQFKLAHAHARDAVFSALDEQHLSSSLLKLSLSAILLQSRAKDRSEYLQRPDLGRMLDEHSTSLVSAAYRAAADIAIVIADGLSAEAVNRHAIPLLEQLLPGFQNRRMLLSPVFLVRQGRVAIGDQIGEGVNARLLLVLIGERPGLSSADSLGVYLTYNPRHGLTDAARNCVSNIRPEGLGYAAAANKILFLCGEALRLQVSGVSLKDHTSTLLE